MERDSIAKIVYVGECAGSHSVGRLWKRWIDIVKECLEKRGLDIGQARRMVQDRSEWLGFVRGNTWGIASGMNLDEMPQFYEAFALWKSICGRAYDLKGIKGKICYSSFS